MGFIEKLFYLIISTSLFSCYNSDSINISQNNPNILLIIADDQRFDALSVIQRSKPDGRFPWIQTPNLDRLASQGVLFKNAFVTTSLCSPSRAAILTGNYNHTNGIESNLQHFNQPSFASILGTKGYETAYFGKWHMGDQRERPGFAKSFSFVRQGRYYNTNFFFNQTPIETNGWVDEISTNFLLNSLSNEHSNPFCYVIGFKSSHSPWDVSPPGLEELYSTNSVEPVDNFGVFPPFLQHVSRSGYANNYWRKWGEKDLNYHRNLTAMDEQVGRIMQSLEENDLMESTIVIFMSDNGLYQGEHALRDKRSAYEESMRIPLIICSNRGIKNAEIEKLVLNIDIAPTILELAGFENAMPTQGKSLVPLIDNNVTNWRTSFVYRYRKESSIGPKFNITALRTESHKLILYEDNDSWTELFDIINDPYEIKNLKDDSDLLNFHLEELDSEKIKILLE